MLTPIEIQSKNFKSGIGYDRKDVDNFMREILSGYEKLYKENVELKDKISVLNDGIQYYKTIEKTLQKALVLAEQTAEETKQAALKSAKAIEKEARGKADLIIADAKNELNHINQMITGLTQQYECYKVQYKQLAAAQIELLQSPTFELTLMNGEPLKTSYTNPLDSDNLSTFASEESVELVNTSKNNSSLKDISTKEDVNENQKEETNKQLIKKLVDEFVDEKFTDESDIKEQGVSARKPIVKDLFTKEELEAFEKITNYVNNESRGSKNHVTNNEDSDFTLVEQVAITLDDTNDSKEKKESSSESEFEFIDFEVNLD